MIPIRCCSVPPPTGNHLDAYCHQLPRPSAPGQPEPLRIGAVFAPVRAHSRALHRLCIRGNRVGCQRYSPLFHNVLHGSWLHLILSMWTIWLFGPTIEDRLGHGRHLVFYLACGLAASIAHVSIAHVMFNPTSIVPALSTSGAIGGILGCYMRLFPLARIVVLVPNPAHPAIHRSLRVCLYRSLVLASDFRIGGGTSPPHLQRRRCLVGPCRRVRGGVHAWPSPGPIRPRVLPGRRRVRLR